MGKLSDLPAEILLDIITRLPTESVLECKLVCKPWRRLVSHHPTFSHLHLTHLLNNHHDPASKLSFLTLTDFNERHDEHQQFHYFEYSGNQDEIPIDSIRMVNLTPPLENGYRIIGSQNGLIGLETDTILSDHHACICNPITKEYVLLPESNRLPNNYYVCSGFGYLRETNEYKVVRINYDLWDWETHHLVCVEVCTLGSDNGWRSIGEYRLSFHQLNFDSEYGVFANETLYWNPYGGNIVAFNLTDEKFCELPTLPCLLLACAGDLFSEVGILGGDLSYSLGDFRGRINIWLLKKIGYQNMMGQEEYLSLPGSEEFVRHKPLALMSSGEVLFFSHTTNTHTHTHLHSYDIRSSSLRTIVNFPRRVCQIIPHMNTLISPKALREVDMDTVE